MRTAGGIETGKRAEEACLHSIRRFLVFYDGAHPPKLAESDR